MVNFYKYQFFFTKKAKGKVREGEGIMEGNFLSRIRMGITCEL